MAGFFTPEANKKNVNTQHNNRKVAEDEAVREQHYLAGLAGPLEI